MGVHSSCEPVRCRCVGIRWTMASALTMPCTSTCPKYTAMPNRAGTVGVDRFLLYPHRGEALAFSANDRAGARTCGPSPRPAAQRRRFRYRTSMAQRPIMMLVGDGRGDGSSSTSIRLGRLTANERER